MPRRPRKAVLPVAGLGTRFLPATKAQPKEMLPLIDTPTIQLVVEEAVAAGIEDILLVTGRHKRAIADHFDHNLELEMELERRGQTERLHLVRELAELADVHYIRQPKPLGLGDAILRARAHVGEEPFAVLLADDVIRSQRPCIGQLATIYADLGAPVVAVEEVPRESVGRYGIVRPSEAVADGTFRCSDLVEKPAPEAAPSNLAVIGRYVLTPQVFDQLARLSPGAGGELQLTDALAAMARSSPFFAYRYEGRRFDLGEPAGFVKATILAALERPDLGPEIRAFLRTLQERPM